MTIFVNPVLELQFLKIYAESHQFIMMTRKEAVHTQSFTHSYTKGIARAGQHFLSVS